MVDKAVTEQYRAERGTRPRRVFLDGAEYTQHVVCMQCSTEQHATADGWIEVVLYDERGNPMWDGERVMTKRIEGQVKWAWLHSDEEWAKIEETRRKREVS